MQDNQFFPPNAANPRLTNNEVSAEQQSWRKLPTALSTALNATEGEQFKNEIEHFSQDEANSYLKTGNPNAQRGGGRTLARWRRQGTGPPYIRLPGRIVYRKCDLDEWLVKRRVQPVRERGGVA